MASSVAVAGSDVVVLREDRYRVGDSERQIPGWRFRNTVDVGIAAELLLGPLVLRLVFGGPLDADLAERVVSAYLAGAAPAIVNEDWF